MIRPGAGKAAVAKAAAICSEYGSGPPGEPRGRRPAEVSFSQRSDKRFTPNSDGNAVLGGVQKSIPPLNPDDGLDDKSQ